MKYVDPDGRAFGFEVDDEKKTIEINVNIHIYGKLATDELAKKFEDTINEEWNKNFSYKYNKQEYTVIFNVQVDVATKRQRYSIKNKLNDIYIKITDDKYFTSNINYSTLSGTWRGVGYGGFSLDNDNPAAHEFGHILGFNDYYNAESEKIQEYWKGNIMGEPALAGKVEQKNIDILCNVIMKQKSKKGYVWPIGCHY